MVHGKLQATGLIQNSHLALIKIMDIPSRPGVGGQLFSALSDEGINVELIVHLVDLENDDHIALCVDRDDLNQALAVARHLGEELGAKAVASDAQVALLSLFGLEFREQRGVAGQMFKALGDHNIHIRAISTTLSTISCLVDADDLDEAVQALREAFTLP